MPGARHDAGACTHHGPPDALAGVGVTAYADTAYCGVATTTHAPFRRLRYDRTAGRFVTRPLGDGYKMVNRSIAALRGPGERANADLKYWRVLCKIRSSPASPVRPVV